VTGDRGENCPTGKLSHLVYILFFKYYFAFQQVVVFFPFFGAFSSNLELQYSHSQPFLDFFLIVVMQSKIPSGMCAKLRTVAASNNRDHASQSLLLLLARATFIMVLFFAHIPFVVNHTFNATPPERLQQCQGSLPGYGGLHQSMLN